MNPIRVVEEKVFVQASTGFRDSHVLMKVNLFIFDRSPESLHEDIVIHPTPAIHADAFSFKDSREIVAGKLRALIGVENLRYGNLQSILQSPCTEGGIHGGGDIPSQAKT
jgi:hypothetical protein